MKGVRRHHACYIETSSVSTNYEIDIHIIANTARGDLLAGLECPPFLCFFIVFFIMDETKPTL